jgi:hypothetical protein
MASRSFGSRSTSTVVLGAFPYLLLCLLTVACQPGTTCGGGAVSPPSPDIDAARDGTASPSPSALFELHPFVDVGIGSENGAAWEETGQAARPLDLGPGPFQSVTLHVDLVSACFPFEGWAANPPPAGQSWPPTCDAFDRNFDLDLDDPLSDPAPAAAGDANAVAPPGDPGIDAGASLASAFNVVHAITPFGGPEHLDVDLTDLANARPGKHRLRVRLQSYADPAGKVTGSNAGWTVNASVAVVPGAPPRAVLAAAPLFTTRVSPGDSPPVGAFVVPAGALAGRIEYRASGHGQGVRDPGCVGPADEFCTRHHLIRVDGIEVAATDPHRDDCQTLCTLAHDGTADKGFDYCAENPCGAIASVRAPRANWCPGSMTAPQIWDAFAAFAAPGPHTFSTEIANIGQGGSWLVSATYYAYSSPW